MQRHPSNLLNHLSVHLKPWRFLLPSSMPCTRRINTGFCWNNLSSFDLHDKFEFRFLQFMFVCLHPLFLLLFLHFHPLHLRHRSSDMHIVRVKCGEKNLGHHLISTCLHKVFNLNRGHLCCTLHDIPMRQVRFEKGDLRNMDYINGEVVQQTNPGLILSEPVSW